MNFWHTFNEDVGVFIRNRTQQLISSGKSPTVAQFLATQEAARPRIWKHPGNRQTPWDGQHAECFDVPRFSASPCGTCEPCKAIAKRARKAARTS